MRKYLGDMLLRRESFSEIVMGNMTREEKTVAAMIGIYCRQHHGLKKILCTHCQELLDYTLKRLKHCPFKINKPTCAKCTIHCYQLSKREEIRAVMRYSGPRMIYRHPVLAFFHLLAGFKSSRSI